MGEQIVGRAPARRRQLGMDMVRSLGLVAVALLVWLFFAHPQTPDTVRSVQWVPVADSAAATASYAVLAPQDDFAWSATSARIEPQSDGTVAWQAGFLTPEQDYAAIMQRGVFAEQAEQAQQDWIAEQTRDGAPGETVRLAGLDWTRLVGDPVPDDRRSLLLVQDGVVTVVTGSAQWSELEKLASGLEVRPAD
jgi:hypothetical protein